MDDAMTLSFDDDEDKLGGLVYFDRKAFSTYIEDMHHSEEDALNKLLDGLIEANDYAELGNFPFLSFTKPADFEGTRNAYSVEPMGTEHKELRLVHEEADLQCAIDRAKEHYRLMWLCAHPEDVADLEARLNMSAEELASVWRVTDLDRVEDIRAGIASTLRRVARMKKSYTPEEIAEANRVIDELDIDEIRLRSKLTETKRREHEKYERDRQQLKDAIASLEREIKDIADVVVPRSKEEAQNRKERYADAFDLLKEERQLLEHLYEPLRQALVASNETARKLTFVCRTTFNVERHASRGMELFDRRRSLYRDQGELEVALKAFFEHIEAADFDRDAVKDAVNTLLSSFTTTKAGDRFRLSDQLRKDRTLQDFAEWFYSIDDYAVSYSIEFDGKDLQLLSPGEKGIVLLLLYLEAETEDNRPLIIDQPDDNLDNVSVYPGLIDYFRLRKKSRQVIIITHNPNLVVTTDAEQVFVAKFDGTKTPKITYRAGSLENTSATGELGIREEVCRILEGGTKAFQLREQRYAIT